MSCRLVRPEPVRLELEGGDWIIVRRRLSAGEERAMFARMRAAGATPDHIDPLQVGPARTLAYLLDWSLTDAAGLPIVIRGLEPADVLAALDQQDPDYVREVAAAILAHEEQEYAARDAEKKTRNGGRPSVPISPSAAPTDGPIPTSSSSTPMCIA